MSGGVCAHCGRPIAHPAKGSYPASVKWVHEISPLGGGNRYCDTSGRTAEPTRPTPPAETGDQP